VRRNRFLERKAVALCGIQPNDKVLEVGFGPGLGLEAASELITGELSIQFYI